MEEPVVIEGLQNFIQGYMLIPLADMLYKRPHLTKTLAYYFGGRLATKPPRFIKKTIVKQVEVYVMASSESKQGKALLNYSRRKKLIRMKKYPQVLAIRVWEMLSCCNRFMSSTIKMITML